jgi:DNA-binding winged helix-turn-helix (wHTH) protein
LPEYRFGDFLLDPDERLLSRDGQRLDLSGRYLDALALLVRERGKLVSKDRFHEEVWHGVPVTDEALTQCIRSLRRLLDDKAERPRFIETVPRHGYRFIATIDDQPQPAGGAQVIQPHANLIWLFAAGLIGAGIAGFAGGLLYGVVASSAAGAAQGMGTISVLLVLMCLSILTAVLGGGGVVAGLVLVERMTGRSGPWLIAGGALGGLVVGTSTKLLGLDAFNLLLGRAPIAMAGGMEGLLVGAGIGLAAWITALGKRQSLGRAALAGALAGAAAGCLVVLAGGQLMAGSLDTLAQVMPGSRLRLDSLGMLAGEQHLGPASRLIYTSVEGALFTAAIVAAMTLARRQGS